MTNYYTLLKIQQNADEKAIREAVKKERRIWNQRTAHPKSEIRTDAENKIREIAEAEKILLNNSRAQYDNELRSYREPTQSPANTGNEERDWLAVAISYIEQGEYNSASYVIQQAVNQQPNNPEVWYRKFQISNNLGNNKDADFELHEAIRLDPNNSEYYSDLGEFYFGRELYGKAIEQFSTAIRKGGDEDWNNSRIAISIADPTNYEASSRAVQSIELLYNRHKDNSYYQYMYALILLLTAQSACSNQLMDDIPSIEYQSRNHMTDIGQRLENSANQARSNMIDTLNRLPAYFITNERQLEVAKGLHAKAVSINTSDNDTRETVAEIGEMINQAEKRGGGCTGVTLMVVGVIEIVCALGIGFVGAPAGLIIFLILFGGGFFLGGYFSSKTPAYKSLALPKEVKATGVQKQK